MNKIGDSFSGIIKHGNGQMGILVIITVTVEQLASFIVFECPCDDTNIIYGYSYMLGPCE